MAETRDEELDQMADAVPMLDERIADVQDDLSVIKCEISHVELTSTTRGVLRWHSRPLALGRRLPQDHDNALGRWVSGLR